MGTSGRGEMQFLHSLCKKLLEIHAFLTMTHLTDLWHLRSTMLTSMRNPTIEHVWMDGEFNRSMRVLVNPN